MTDRRLADVARWLREAGPVVVLTGAGISTESGIPDYRGPQGIWTRDPRAERLSNIGYYVADPAIRRESWQRRLEHLVEIHGSLRESVCLACGDRRPMQATLDRVRAGEADPQCLACGGILKSATISFGQNLDPLVLARAEAAADRAGMFVAAGTSLTVSPVAWLPERTLAAGGMLVILNAEPTPLDERAHAVLRGQLGDLLPAIAERARVP